MLDACEETTFMRRVVTPPSLAISRWTRFVSAFALLLLLAAFFLHRVFAMPTLVAMNLAKFAYIVAAGGLLLALAGGFAIWRTGAAGTGNIALGMLVSTGILMAPPLILSASSHIPQINDLTTDFAKPPPFQSVSGLRPLGSNPVAYPGNNFAEQQRAHYPDLKPMVINRSSPETFALVVDALKRENMTVVREDPPSEDGTAPGFLEAPDRTLVFGFYDDVAIRVSGTQDASRVDIRSASRFGRHDLGRNAARMRTIMRQIVVRLEETVPAIDASVDKEKAAAAKKGKSARRARVSARKSRGRARARARRARERRERRRRRRLRAPNYISPIPGL